MSATKDDDWGNWGGDASALGKPTSVKENRAAPYRAGPYNEPRREGRDGV